MQYITQLFGDAQRLYLDQNPWIGALVVLGFSIVGGIILRWLFIRFLRISRDRQGSVLAGAVLKRLNNRTRLFFPLLVFLTLQPLIRLEEPYDTIIFKATEILLFITIGWLLLKLIDVLEDLAYVHYAEERRNPFQERKVKTQLQFLKRILGVVIVIIVLASVLLTINEVRQAGAAILTSAGVAGIVVGIAAQKSLANLLAGFQIAITQPIKIDDAVIVESEWGIIEEITLTYVVVKVWDKRRIVLPINYFIEKPFQNWTRHSADLTGVIMLYVDYSLPVEALRRALSDILEEEALWDRESDAIQVVDTTDKTMTLRVLVSAGDAASTFTLRCSVREKLISFIREQYPEALPKNRIAFSDKNGAEPARGRSEQVAENVSVNK